MKYTENYHLPQWVKTDRIMMDDFNQMCADIEAGLLKTAQDAAAGISGAATDAAAAAAAASAAAAAAQTTADQAVSAAAAAQATANAAYCPSNKPYAIGTYTGTGSELTVTVGFRPKFLIITNPRSTDSYMFTAMASEDSSWSQLELTSVGFKVKENLINTGTSTAYPPLLNNGTVKYVYIAFR